MASLSADSNTDTARFGLASLWQETAREAAVFPSLQNNLSADVAIVGAGYTGLSTALALAEKGIRAIVVEAREPSWGASGRNGGQVIPGLKYDPPEILHKYGPKLGPELVKFIGGAPSVVFDLIEKYGIDCDAQRCGWIQPAHNAAMEPTLQKRGRSWAETGADVELLDRNRLADLLGSTTYRSGWLDKRGGCLNPLGYARGLARAAAGAGATIFSNSPVQALERTANGYRLRTSGGSVEAGQVLLATNGYTDGLWPNLRQSLVPAHSFQVATDPLPDSIRKTILPFGHVSSDSRRILLYFRLDAEGRFLMGGVGSVGEPSSRAVFAHLTKATRHVFPQMTAPFRYHWYGKVALTQDFLPHVHELAPGLHAALGYNGRGVAMATAMGTLMARRIAGETADALPFPTTNLRTIPFHGLRNLYVAAARTYYRLRDVTA